MLRERLKETLGASRAPPACALVTGATGGIGEAFARTFGEETRLVLTGRDADKLALLRAEFGTRCEVVPADLTEPAGIAAVVEAADVAGVDLLVNNAGLGEYGTFLSSDFAKHRATVRVNIEAVLELIHRVVPAMVDRAEIAGQRAGLINVASSVAFVPVPTLATYAASKAMVLSFTESFAAEMADRPIDILAACPGAVRTEFGSRAGFDGAMPTAMAPAKVAEQSLRALGRQTTAVIGPVSFSAFGPVAAARSLFGQAFMRASSVMERVR